MMVVVGIQPAVDRGETLRGRVGLGDGFGQPGRAPFAPAGCQCLLGGGEVVQQQAEPAWAHARNGQQCGQGLERGGPLFGVLLARD